MTNAGDGVRGEGRAQLHGTRHLSVTVRWSDLEAVDETGALLRPVAVRVNHRSVSEGDWTNTTTTIDAAGAVLQVTNTPRTVEQGALLLIGL
jgi:hypothetical protein